MNIVDIILDKRYGKSLSDEQIQYWIDGVTNKTIPDYQTSALLMAIVLNGMDEREMTTLTLAMAASGEQNDLSYVDGIPVDKHSTGGVGDKVTPVLLPLCATFGVQSVKLSGRGLGFTGGTVDKFESIEGFNVQVDVNDFPSLVKEHSMVISGQTPDLAPADKILYALRDVTGTVDSIPLIASSIMSKKIAGGAKVIVLDVTCGYGAFMKTPEQAEELANAMIKIGNLSGRKTVAVITDMNQPLGRTCGNVLEMQEVCEILHGKGSSDVVDVICTLASQMITLAECNDGLSADEVKLECAKRLADGSAWEKYQELIKAQGGYLKDNGYPLYREIPFEEMRVTSPVSGYITKIKADVIGRASVLLGAGRLAKTDSIDYGAGICFFAKVGDKVHRGDVVCSLCRGSMTDLPEDRIFDVMEMVMDAFEYSDEAPELNEAVIKIIQ